MQSKSFFDYHLLAVKKLVNVALSMTFPLFKMKFLTSSFAFIITLGFLLLSKLCHRLRNHFMKPFIVQITPMVLKIKLKN